MYYWWDPTYILVVIGAIICLIASARVKPLMQNIQNTAVCQD